MHAKAVEYSVVKSVLNLKKQVETKLDGKARSCLHFTLGEKKGLSEKPLFPF